MNEFITWEILGTYAGTVLFTSLAVQFTKEILDKIWHIPTRVYAYAIALVSLICGLAFTGNLSLQSGSLSVFNAMLVAMASTGGYDTLIAFVGGREDD